MITGYEYLKDERFARRLTLRQLAKEIGCSDAGLSLIENGKVPNPSHKTIQKLKAFFEATPKVETADFNRVEKLEEAVEALTRRVRSLECENAVMGGGGGLCQ